MWIITYVVVMGNIRNNFGDESLYSILGLITVVLTFFIAKNKLGIKYGLVGLLDIKIFVFHTIYSVNFGELLVWRIYAYIVTSILAIITMALVGYVEEIIFRGLLYKAIEGQH